MSALDDIKSQIDDPEALEAIDTICLQLHFAIMAEMFPGGVVSSQKIMNIIRRIAKQHAEGDRNVENFLSKIMILELQEADHHDD